MVLSSQSSRGRSKRRRSGRGGGGRRWPWVLLLLAGAGLVGVVVISGGEEGAPSSSRASNEEPTEAEAADDPGQRIQSAVGPEAERASEASGGGRAELGPKPELGRGSVEPAPDVPTLTMDGQPGDLDVSRDAEPMPELDAEPEPSEPEAPSRSAGDYDGELREGLELIEDEQYLEGRALLSELLFTEPLSSAEQQAIRDALDRANQRLLYSQTIHPEDPTVEGYEVQSGDTLGAIAREYDLTYPYLERINGIDANRLMVGQTVKVVKGPIHARVVKGDYMIDLYVEDTGGQPVYIRSFPVGLGEHDSTPLGQWVVTPGRKAVNPDWRNPRTNEYYASDDPENPIGDYWIALSGLDASNRDATGYGIHGTIEPETIGQQRSMGCIRLGDEDIEQVFFMLVEGKSMVHVLP